MLRPIRSSRVAPATSSTSSARAGSPPFGPVAAGSYDLAADGCPALNPSYLLSSDALLRAVRDVVQERDAMEREFADMQGERNAAEDLLAPEQLRELYAARECARAAGSADPP
jgi:hypothetical protein